MNNPQKIIQYFIKILKIILKFYELLRLLKNPFTIIFHLFFFTSISKKVRRKKKKSAKAWSLYNKKA